MSGRHFRRGAITYYDADRPKVLQISVSTTMRAVFCEAYLLVRCPGLSALELERTFSGDRDFITNVLPTLSPTRSGLVEEEPLRGAISASPHSFTAPQSRLKRRCSRWVAP